MRLLLTIGFSLVLASFATAAPKVPPPEILGLRLGMSDDVVRSRLNRIGRLTEMQPEGGGRKQIWSLRHRRFLTLNLRLTPNHDLQWCTAYTRPRRVRYVDLGDTTLARKAGRFIWIWNVPPSEKHPAYQITARGQDPVYAASVALSPSLSRPEGNQPSTAEADSAR